MFRHFLIAVLLVVSSIAATGQWTIQDSHVSADLRGIHAIGNGVAWASGTKGTVLRTIDDGTTWQTCSIPPGAEALDFRGVHGFDADTAIVMSSGKGNLSRLYKTTDACKSWKLVFANPDKDGFWDSIQFLSDNLGYLFGDPIDGKFAIFLSDDSGNSWIPWIHSQLCQVSHCHLAKSKSNEFIFAASNSSALAPADNGSFVFVTGGRGGSHIIAEANKDWCDCRLSEGFDSRKLPISSGDSSGAFSIAGHFVDSKYRGRRIDYMVVGGDYQKPNLPGTSVFIPKDENSIFTDFFAHHHEVKPTTPPHGYRSAVAYDYNAKAWITVGPNGTDVSTDDGRNWRAIHPSSTDMPEVDRNWNALSLPFVVGPKGRIGKLRAVAFTR